MPPKNTLPLQAVILPIIPTRNDDDKFSFHCNELIKQAKSVQLVLQHDKTKQTYEHILFLGENKWPHNLQLISQESVIKGFVLCVVAHGNPEVIGSQGHHAINAQELAELFASVLIESLNINHIKFLSCNSGYERNDAPSYAQAFYIHMKKLGFNQLDVSGYIGYMGEMRGKPHIYVTARPFRDDPNQRLYRADQSEIIFKADGNIIRPKISVKPILPNEAHDRDLGFEAIQASNSQHSRLDHVVNTHIQHTGIIWGDTSSYYLPSTSELGDSGSIVFDKSMNLFKVLRCSLFSHNMNNSTVILDAATSAVTNSAGGKNTQNFDVSFDWRPAFFLPRNSGTARSNEQAPSQLVEDAGAEAAAIPTMRHAGDKRE